MKSSEIFQDKPLILFDGVCNFCNASVNFILKYDKDEKFYFTSLQSETGQEILKKFNQKTTDFSSILLLQNNQLYEKSEAILKIGSQLNRLKFITKISNFFPSFFRNFIYDFIAKNRYTFFGKTDICQLPTPAQKRRFL